MPSTVALLENQLGHSMFGLSEQHFEGDLPMGKSFKSNILAASEELVVQSLISMRDALIDFFGLDKVGAGQWC